jgi:hypothetical protein
MRRAPPIVWVFFALVAVVYTCVSPYIASVNNPNENVRTYMTMAIVEEHSFRIDDVVARYGWVNDMARVPDPGGKFHYASVKGPATSFSGVPFYWVFSKVARWFGHPVPTLRTPPAERAWWLRAATFVVRLFAVQLPCFAFLVWLERWLRGTTHDVVLRLSAVAAVGLGTNYLAHATMYVSHATVAMAAFGGFAVTLSERIAFVRSADRRASRAFVVGLCAGLVTLLEYQALPVSIVLALYAVATFWRPTRLGAFVLGGLVNVGLLALYQRRACGSALLPCHRYSEGFLWLHTKTLGLGKPDLTFAHSMSFSHAFGFFGTSPFMFLGFLAIPFALIFAHGVRRLRRERRIATAVWIVAMLGLWIIVSAASNPHGGWSVGPRYLGAAPPFFAFGATCALERIAGRSFIRRLFARGVAGGLVVASAIQTGFVSIVFNTIPESVSRPLTQIAIPLARAGFVPHHAAELVGWMAPYFWYGVLACLLGAALVAGLAFGGHGQREWWGRILVAALFAFVGLRPAVSKPAPDEPTDPNVTQYFTEIWEPKGRDFVHSLRETAERYGTRKPCLWYKLADMERSVGMVPQAMRDEVRAGAPKSICR